MDKFEGKDFVIRYKPNGPVLYKFPEEDFWFVAQIQTYDTSRMAGEEIYALVNDWLGS